MNTIVTHAEGPPALTRNGAGIAYAGEFEPLLAKAREAARCYSQALDCPAAIYDRNGRAVAPAESSPGETGNEERLCVFCGNYCPGSSGARAGNAQPCAKTHLDALAESRRAGGVYVYACEAGLVYWTSPLFRNRDYAGALTAGQVILPGREKAREKLGALCGEKTADAAFGKLFEEIPEKTHEEIQGMACLLGICAKEVSEEEENFAEMIRRIVSSEGNDNNFGNHYLALAAQKHPYREIPFPGFPADGGTEHHGDSEYPMEKERVLLAAFRRGDNKTGARILKELMNIIIATTPENFELIRFRTIELVVLLSRAATDVSDYDALLEANNRYLKRIQECTTTETLTENLFSIAEHLAGKIFSFQGIRHASVLRKAERYIWKNYTRKLSLEDIAKASGLSAPYFSSVFKDEMNENLSNYLNRLRVERAMTLLTETAKSLKEISTLCGFEDQSWFSKIFKKFTGTSPGKYRESSGGSQFHNNESRPDIPPGER